MDTGESHNVWYNQRDTVICSMDGRKQGWERRKPFRCHKCFLTRHVPSSPRHVSPHPFFFILLFKTWLMIYFLSKILSYNFSLHHFFSGTVLFVIWVMPFEHILVLAFYDLHDGRNYAKYFLASHRPGPGFLNEVIHSGEFSFRAWNTSNLTFLKCFTEDWGGPWKA